MRSSIQAIGEYPDVRVDDCSFDVNDATAGIDAGTNVTGNGRVTVTRSRFRNGALGVFAWSGGVLDVSGSSFGPYAFRAIQYQGGHGVAENNDVEQCGVNGCVAVIVGAEADVRGNRLRQTRTDRRAPPWATATTPVPTRSRSQRCSSRTAASSARTGTRRRTRTRASS